MPQIHRVTVRGFKSIRALENFELGSLNVLIGANGAGKSNFIGLFRMLSELVARRLRLYVQEQDGPDALLHCGRKRTPQLDAELYFGRSGYRISLQAVGQRLVFSREETWSDGAPVPIAHSLGNGHDETRLHETDDAFARLVWPAIEGWRVYHFHDTSAGAPMRQAQAVRDNLRLKPDGGNLAPFLRMLREQHPESYQRIVETVRMVVPFFGAFVYRPEPGELVDLEWLEADDPDTPRGPRQLSDGTLRFIALATLLLQPVSLQSDAILIDEPELGLHPYALSVLASLLRQASEARQLIVATQSAQLVDHQRPEDVVVVGRMDGASTFERLSASSLTEWLEDYSLGELWKMNVLGGRPVQ